MENLPAEQKGQYFSLTVAPNFGRISFECNTYGSTAKQ
jgi:hypothetical protein